jgi:hypothetical protein
MTSALEARSTCAATSAHSARGWLTGRIHAQPLLAFVACPSTVVGLLAAASPEGAGPAVGLIVRQFPSLLGPIIAALLITSVTRGRRGMLDLARGAVRCRVPAHWWLFAVGSPAVLGGAAVLVMAIGPGAPELRGFPRMEPAWVGGVVRATGVRGCQRPG